MSGSEKKSRRKSAASADPVIPDKLYFRIGEVARLCRLPAYVLRFWETEFPSLSPVKSNTGQRMYRQRDVENVLRIKKLLYEEGFTIAGARKYLSEHASGNGAESPGAETVAKAEVSPAPILPAKHGPAARAHKKFLLDLHEELLAILTLLERE